MAEQEVNSESASLRSDSELELQSDTSDVGGNRDGRGPDSDGDDGDDQGLWFQSSVRTGVIFTLDAFLMRRSSSRAKVAISGNYSVAI